MSKLALITGANGMDAKTLTHILLSKGYHVVLTYRRNTFFDEDKFKTIFIDDLFKYSHSQLSFQVCDVSCQNSVSECIKSVITKHNKLDEVYHLAANSHVGESFKNKELSIQVNGQSHYYFLEALHQYTGRNTRYYGAMTSELFGGKDTGAFNEDSIWNPRSPYAIGKDLGARWINFYRESKDTDMFACYGILFNHSNTYRSPDFAIRKITKAAARIALGKESELKLAHLDWARDEHYSDFGCEAMYNMLQLDKPENFVIGTGTTHWGEEYVDAAFRYFNLDWKKHVKFDAALARPNEVVRLLADCTKAKDKLGWNPNRMAFKQHIEHMCKYDFTAEQYGQAPRPVVL